MPAEKWMVKRMWAGMTDPAGILALQNQAMRAHPLPMRDWSWHYEYTGLNKKHLRVTKQTFKKLLKH